MENYGKIDSQTGIHSRLLDFHRALSFCVETAIAENVDLFIFAGDAYKTAHPSPTQQRLLFDCLLKLFQANIPIVIVVGNHDNPVSFGKAHALDLFGRLPLAGFHVIAQPTSLTVATKSGPVQIVGIPWPSRTTLSLNNSFFSGVQELNTFISSHIAALIAHYASELDPSLPSILVSHLTVSSGKFSGSERRAITGQDPTFLPSQLALAPFDYVALGHLHRHQQLNITGQPPIVYPGSIERIDFGERQDTKGFCLGNIHSKGKTEYRFIEGPTRPFVQIETTIPNSKGQTEVLLAEIEKHNLTEAIVKIVYHVPAGTVDRVDTRALQEACARAHDIASIMPLHAPALRQPRSAIKIDMDLDTALTSYCAQRQISTEQTQRLMLLAHELEMELQTPAADLQDGRSTTMTPLR